MLEKSDLNHYSDNLLHKKDSIHYPSNDSMEKG